MPVVDIDRQVLWIASVVTSHATKINLYIHSKAELERLLLAGDYISALHKLDELEEQGFHSLWAIELRQAILQISSGLTAQKDYVRQIRRERRRDDALAYIAFHGSIRNENTTQIFSFREHFGEIIRGSGYEPALRDWLLLHICDELTPSTDLAGVLRTEEASPLVDWYETFLRIATFVFSHGLTHITAFISGLRLMHGAIEDPRMGRLLSLHPDFETLVEGMPLEDLRTRDAALVEEVLGNDVHVVDIAQRCHLISEGLPVFCSFSDEAQTTAGDLSETIDRELRTLTSVEGSLQSFFTLMRLASNYRFTTLASTFYLPTWRQVTSSMLAEEHLLRTEYIDSHAIRLAHVQLFAGDTRKRLFERFAAQFPLSRSVELQRISLGMQKSGIAQTEEKEFLESISSERLDLAFATQYVREGALPDAISSISHLLDSGNLSIRRDAARIMAGCLLLQPGTHETVKFVVSTVLNESNLSYRMPIADLIIRLDKAYRKRYASSLSTPIIFNLARNRSSQIESYRAYAYEDFLLSHGLTTPSELSRHIDDFDLVELIYYLRWICTPDTMQMSTVFNGTKEYEDERVAVLALLSELDPQNAKEYEAESRAITQNQVIRGGVTQVEENKIYVDVPALRKWADLNLRESYSRYQALRNSGMTAGDAQLLETVRDALKDVAPGSIIFGLPENEATDLLIVMLKKLIDEFLSNGQHGLDCYLSMRVRHGSLAGQLRNPLESHQIITQREADTDQYKSNYYWLSQSGGLDYYRVEGLDESLKSFSRSYDALIDSYSNDFIQIQSSDKPKGLFYLHMSDSGIILLADNILADTTFEEFLDHSFRYVMELLDECLRNVRWHIDSHLRPQTDSLFEKLEAKLAEIGIPYVHELDAAVHQAHTELQRTIESLKQWFYRSEPEKGPSFGFEDLVRIGLMCVTRLHDKFQPGLKVKEPTPELQFQDLSFFSDIFFIVFDNIRVHSGLPAPEVEVKGHVAGRDLHVTVRSGVSAESLSPVNIERISTIKEMIKGGSYLRAVRSEGGTGLIKLRNILRWSPASGPALDFFFDEGKSEFVVQLAVPLLLVQSASGDKHQ